MFQEIQYIVKYIVVHDILMTSRKLFMVREPDHYFVDFLDKIYENFENKVVM